MEEKGTCIITTETTEFTELPIVDCELSENIKDATGKWDNTKAKAFIFGFFHKKKIIQIINFCAGEEMNVFSDTVKKTIESLPTPLFGLNQELELYALKNLTGQKYIIKDVRDIKGKMTSKKALYDLLVKHKRLPEITDPMDFNGQLCIEYFKRITQKDPQSKKLMEDVILHNKNCLIMESAILQHKDFLTSLFNLDKNGWVIGLK